MNPYNPDVQPTNLILGYEAYSTKMINAVKAKDSKIPLVTVQLSGRPMMSQEAMGISDAFIAAWLPCTGGGDAIVSAINGDYLFRASSTANGATNTLPVDWLTTEESLHNYPIYKAGTVLPSISNPMFKAGYGLSTHMGDHDEDDDSNDFASYPSTALSMLLMLAMWVFN